MVTAAASRLTHDSLTTYIPQAQTATNYFLRIRIRIHITILPLRLSPF